MSLFLKCFIPLFLSHEKFAHTLKNVTFFVNSGSFLFLYKSAMIDPSTKTKSKEDLIMKKKLIASILCLPWLLLLLQAAADLMEKKKRHPEARTKGKSEGKVELTIWDTEQQR